MTPTDNYFSDYYFDSDYYNNTTPMTTPPCHR